MGNRQAEYQELTQKAWAQLNREEPPDMGHSRPIVGLCVRPSFADHTAWMVFADSQEEDFVARRSRWDRQFDTQRFTDPLFGLKHGWSTEPTLTTTIIMLPSGKVTVYLQEARALEIPEVLSKSITLDGTRWSLAVKNAFGNQTRTWNWEPPAWKPMIAWAARLFSFLEAQVETSH